MVDKKFNVRLSLQVEQEGEEFFTSDQSWAGFNYADVVGLESRLLSLLQDLQKMSVNDAITGGLGDDLARYGIVVAQGKPA